MKKFAILMAAVTLLSASSVTAFAADINQDTPEKTSELTVSAEKDVSYTLSIPSGTKNDINIDSTAPQSIGSIALSEGNFTSGDITVGVTSDDEFALVNGAVKVPYTLGAAEYKLTSADIGGEAKDVTLTIGELPEKVIAGTYSDVLTFTATANNVK